MPFCQALKYLLFVIVSRLCLVPARCKTSDTVADLLLVSCATGQVPGTASTWPPARCTHVELPVLQEAQVHAASGAADRHRDGHHGGVGL